MIDGLEADVVTLALAYDIDAIAEQTGKIPTNWQKRLANNSSPYTSTIVFLVRKGNPKGIKDWGDLVKPGVEVITPNPKTSGGARWNYLAALGYALRQPGGSEQSAQDFVTRLLKNVPVLDSGARGATNTFVQRGIGDVLLAWENEAFLSINEHARTSSRSSCPRSRSAPSRRSPSSMAWRRSVAPPRWRRPTSSTCTRRSARRSPPGTTTARSGPNTPTRPTLPVSRSLNLITIEDLGGWQAAQKKHFADGGVFDQIYAR